MNGVLAAGTRLYRRARELRTDTLVMVLLLAVALVRGVLYAVFTRPFSSPDEAAHFYYVLSLYRSGGGLAEGPEAHQPPLYYWLGLPFYALVANRSPFAGLLALRLVSVLLTAAAVPLTFWTARYLCPRDRLVPLGTAAFVALVPAYGWLGASVNNDNLAKLLTSAMLCLLVYAISRQFPRWCSLGLLALMAAGIATKATTWPVAIVVAVALTVGLAARTGARRAVVIPLSLVAEAALVVWVLLGPLRPNVAAMMTDSTGQTVSLSPTSIGVLLSRMDAEPFIFQFKTFWLTFWPGIQPPNELYWAPAAICSASLLGLAVRLAGGLLALAAGARPSAEAVSNRVFAWQLLVLVGALALQWVQSFLYFYRDVPLAPTARQIWWWDESFWAMHGRFLFPAIIPLAFLMTWGFRGLLPAKWSRSAVVGMVALLLAVDLASLALLAYGSHAWQV